MVLSACTLGMMDFLRKPSICLSTHVQHCLLTCYSYSCLSVGLNRNGTWVSTFFSVVIWRTEGKWKLPYTLERRWLRRAEQHLGNTSPACKVDCMRRQSPQFASLLSTRQGLKPTREGTSSMSNQWQWAEMLLRHCSTWSFRYDNL